MFQFASIKHRIYGSNLNKEDTNIVYIRHFQVGNKFEEIEIKEFDSWTGRDGADL